MLKVKKLTLEEEAAIMVKAIELKKQGKMDKYNRTRKQIPLQPYILPSLPRNT